VPPGHFTCHALRGLIGLAFVLEIAGGTVYELGRALNLMNGKYLLETLGRDPDFDRRLAVETLLAVWHPVTSSR
jgi:hypothetical protein